MKVYKSLRTRIQYSIYLWTQMRMVWCGWNIWGFAPLWSLCLLPGWATPRLWAKQSRRNLWPRNLWRHNLQAPNITFPCTYLPVVHQSSKTNIYSALLECYYNSVLDRYWTTELHKLISTGSDRSTFPWIVHTLCYTKDYRTAHLTARSDKSI